MHFGTNPDNQPAKAARFFSIKFQKHTRRIKIEEDAKVVASIWGKKFILFLVALVILPRTILNNRVT